tara:strand:- start:1433 stop:1912 length:480 start_codon:yes stop_codon:yes gene_type:complete
MSFTDVLFKPNGRITQGQFWGGWAVLVGANIVASFIPLIGTVISLGLIYVGCCVYGKRLHDMGKSAWIHAIPWAVSLIITIFAIVKMMPVIMQMAEDDPELASDPAFVMAAVGPAMGFLLVSFLVWVGYTIWVGVAGPDPDTNQYGPPAGMVGAPDAFV